MADYDTAIADMEAKLEELKQAREVSLLPDVPGHYRSGNSVYLLTYSGLWYYGGGSGITREHTVTADMKLIHKNRPLVRQKLVDA